MTVGDLLAGSCMKISGKASGGGSRIKKKGRSLETTEGGGVFLSAEPITLGAESPVVWTRLEQAPPTVTPVERPLVEVSGSKRADHWKPLKGVSSCQLNR